MAIKLKNKATWGESLLGMIGIGQSKGWRTLFLVFTFLGLVPNIVVLIGCMTKQTQSIYLFRISSADLVDATSNVTTLSTEALDVPGLPDHWYWGMSGLCATYKDDEVYCKRAFPPLYSIEDMITFGLEGQSGKDDAKVKDSMTPWRKALSQLEDDIGPMQSGFKTMIKASAGLFVLSTVFALCLAGLAFASLTFWKGKPPRWMLYIGAFVDACFFTGGGMLAIFAMNNGPRAIIELSSIDQGNERTFIGPGFFVLFAGTVFKLVSIGIFFFMTFFVLLLLVFLVWCCVESCSRKKRDADANSDVIPIYEFQYPDQKSYF